MQATVLDPFGCRVATNIDIVRNVNRQPSTVNATPPHGRIPRLCQFWPETMSNCEPTPGESIHVSGFGLGLLERRREVAF